MPQTSLVPRTQHNFFRIVFNQLFATIDQSVPNAYALRCIVKYIVPHAFLGFEHVYRQDIIHATEFCMRGLLPHLVRVEPLKLMRAAARPHVPQLLVEDCGTPCIKRGGNTHGSGEGWNKRGINIICHFLRGRKFCYVLYTKNKPVLVKTKHQRSERSQMASGRPHQLYPVEMRGNDEPIEDHYRKSSPSESGIAKTHTMSMEKKLAPNDNIGSDMAASYLALPAVYGRAMLAGRGLSRYRQALTPQAGERRA